MAVAEETKAPGLSHVDARGEVRMVDVGDKPVTERTALAGGRLCLSEATLDLLFANTLPKGDALATARLAGILAAKRTADLIPLCHQVALAHVEVRFRREPGAVAIEAEARATDRTGVEMEALTAVAVAGLTLYDMVKAVERGARLDAVELIRKEGGRHGTYQR
jgi:cyclic pyranopterin phosphate synthase